MSEATCGQGGRGVPASHLHKKVSLSPSRWREISAATPSFLFKPLNAVSGGGEGGGGAGLVGRPPPLPSAHGPGDGGAVGGGGAPRAGICTEGPPRTTCHLGCSFQREVCHWCMARPNAMFQPTSSECQRLATSSPSACHRYGGWKTKTFEGGS